jgi:hypothetical protein
VGLTLPFEYSKSWNLRDRLSQYFQLVSINQVNEYILQVHGQPAGGRHRPHPTTDIFEAARLLWAPIRHEGWSLILAFVAPDTQAFPRKELTRRRCALFPLFLLSLQFASACTDHRFVPQNKCSDFAAQAYTSRPHLNFILVQISTRAPPELH